MTIEEVVGDTPEPERSALARHLILLDVDYRRRRGEAPRPEDYHQWYSLLGLAWFAREFEGAAASSVFRYRLADELDHGGMGSVLRGYDPHLGRELAVKVLLEKHRGHTQLVQRFLEEARIGARLQHPGIVPVYDRGEFPDRRPFFTMKLVKGQTLDDLLKRRASPQDALPRFLTVFEQVCQTLAYAHSARVIHRDLKPANVMVGAFGEVQVMDWGFAKVLAENGDASALDKGGEVSAIESPRDQTEVESQPGTVLGTFAYMAPEQARGEIDKIDDHADVFGLGAILCVILTGQPPYTANSGQLLQLQAAEGDLAGAYARLDGCGADVELVRLCKQCLAVEREERPRDAGTVARAVTAYRAGVEQKLRAAELERTAAEARVEEAKATAAAERRARRRSVAVVVLLSLFLLVAGVGGMWLQRHYADTRQGVESMLNTAAGLRDAAHWDEAKEVLEQAEGRVAGMGMADLRPRVTQAQADLRLARRLDEIRQHGSIMVEGKFDRRSADQDYAAAFREARLGQEGDDIELVAVRIRNSNVARQLVTALYDWVHHTKNRSRLEWLLGRVW